jgi:hypothetical protein
MLGLRLVGVLELRLSHVRVKVGRSVRVKA